MDSHSDSDMPLAKMICLHEQVDKKRERQRLVHAQKRFCAPDETSVVPNVGKEMESPSKRRAAAVGAHQAWSRLQDDKISIGVSSDEESLDDSDNDPDYNLPLVVTNKKLQREKNVHAMVHHSSTELPTSSYHSSSSNMGDTGVMLPSLPEPNVTVEDSSLTAGTTEDESAHLPKRGRRNEQSWKRNSRKKLKNSGQAYTTSRGKSVPARTMSAGCEDTCRLKCHGSFSFEERTAIFNQFWALQHVDLQRQFISKCVSKGQKKRCYTGVTSRRENTFQYSFIQSGTNVRVCKKFVLATLGVKQDIVFGALKKMTDHGAPTLDQRGKHPCHPTVDEAIITGIKKHITSFPHVPSHYCRQSSQKHYLDSSLSLAMMYRLYVESCRTEAAPCAKEATYKRVLYESFNIGFHHPKKDQCDVCQAFENTPNPSTEERQKHADHLRHRDEARAYKDSLKEKAKADPSVSSACFDLQQVLQCPRGETSSFYYKRKLSVYNLTVYDLATSDVFCHLWTEALSARGANQIASCVYNFIEVQAAKGVNEIHLISDNCSGQNRNRYVATMLWYAMKVHPALQEIEHCFLERGHTQNENDSVHSVISRAAKHIPIYTPQQWSTLIRGARRGKRLYDVKDMTEDDIFDFTKLSTSLKNFDKDNNGDKVHWMKLRSMRIFRQEPGVIHIKYGEASVRLDLFRGKRKSDNAGQVSLDILKERAGVSEAKKADLVSLCGARLIPAILSTVAHY